MIHVALQMLVGDRLKYLGLVCGLSFAALLIVQQASIFTGFASRTGAWIRDTSSFDLWVTNEQVEFSDDLKFMGDNALNRVRSVDGVAWAVPAYKSFLRVRLPDGTLVGIRVVGLDDASLVGGPPIMVQGSLDMLRMDRAVIVDHEQLDKALRLRRPHRGQPPRPLATGDRIDINDHESIIVGTYRRSTDFFWDPIIYTTFSRARQMAPPERRTTTYLMVKVREGHDPLEVAQRIETATGLAARSSEQFEAITRDFILDRTGILINFGITIALGFVIGLLVSGLLLYLFTAENMRYFGTLKAIGADNRVLVTMLIVQILTVALLGIGIGLGLACLSGVLLANVGLAFTITWQVVVIATLGVLACCSVAGLMSIRRVMRIEPAVVFRS